MTKFRLECDGERTKIWVGDSEISNMTERVEFSQAGNGIPRVELTFYPIDPVLFAAARKSDRDG